MFVLIGCLYSNADRIPSQGQCLSTFVLIGCPYSHADRILSYGQCLSMFVLIGCPYSIQLEYHHKDNVYPCLF